MRFDLVDLQLFIAVAEARREALEMPDEERTRRARGLQRSALAHTPATWLAGQLRAIDEVRGSTL